MDLGQCDGKSGTDVKKHTFALKPMRKDGLILQLYHSQDNPKSGFVRFTLACFNESGFILCAVDVNGALFLVNLQRANFWQLPDPEKASVLAFSPLDKNDLIVGCADGQLKVLDFHSGKIKGVLSGHREAVKELTFSADHLCLTTSPSEAYIFDLKCYAKIHSLALSSDVPLKHVLFMPVTNHVLACFNDGIIHIWKFGSFESFKQILPAKCGKNYSLKCIAFTRNGRAMVVAGSSPQLAIFCLDNWTLLRVVSLPDLIRGIKQLQFVSQPFDGGSNKILSILSTSGVVHFFDMESHKIISKIENQTFEVAKFTNSNDGKHLACILSNGVVDIYNASQYFVPPNAPIPAIVRRPKSSIALEAKKKFLAEESTVPAPPKLSDAKLTRSKMKIMLKEFSQYPDAYRILIWKKILQTPNNVACYASLVDRTNNFPLDVLLGDYKLRSKADMKNLKRLLSDLSNWCPFLSQVSFLPLFIFPFVKLIHNDPMTCFEIVSSVIVNWCQLWFEDQHRPPRRILMSVENILAQHDPQLYNHFSSCNISSDVFVWNLMSCAFSEVLTKSEWCILWDHILTNEPSFFLMTVPAYCITLRSSLLKLNASEDFEFFFFNQNPVNLSLVIKKAYKYMATTDAEIHPRQFLSKYKKLEVGSYPMLAAATSSSFANDSLGILGAVKTDSSEEYFPELEVIDACPKNMHAINNEIPCAGQDPISSTFEDLNRRLSNLRAHEIAPNSHESYELAPRLSELDDILKSIESEVSEDILKYPSSMTNEQDKRNKIKGLDEKIRRVEKEVQKLLDKFNSECNKHNVKPKRIPSVPKQPPKAPKKEVIKKQHLAIIRGFDARKKALRTD